MSALARVRRIDLLNANYLAAFVACGGSWELLSKTLANVLDVPDLKIGHVAPHGIETRLFVESDSPDWKVTGCCSFKNAVPWPEAAALLQGFAGADAGRTPGPGTRTSDPAPQGGTP